ncbi:transketolase family protein [Novosphingobium flavum]|uniref:Transketolase family protein n=1 Tax=Novosphingobium aerophilum TaxID=2839843 RepID=A0A7X1KD52_9SPHN|nr:transketolase C-terminal domain-containing protein [Novosphingobium aerophilum]MBC2652938.1 transketolase family protein [Novosphingobium aerophilum]MBC2662018.1 transketolase family protein [Novosphingobium aerophilum]
MSAAAPAAIGAKLFDCRDAYVAALEDLAATDPRIVAVVNDSVGSSKLGGFRTRFPERLINVGIAEQNMVGVGAGLANGGKIAFVSGAACFLTARSLEQVKADLAYSNANVKLCGISSGVAYGELGPTHHSIEDVAWLRTMGNITVLVPADPWETDQAIRAAAALAGPVFIRLSRMGVPALERPADASFTIGKAETLRKGSDVAIIANGTMVWRALDAAAALAGQGIAARVINMSTITPLDEAAILAAAQTGGIVTVEEGSVRGGLGGAVAEIVTTRFPCPMRILGFPGFLPTGSAEFLMEHFGLTAAGIAAAARAVLGR